MNRWLPLVLVGAGSFVGGNARYLVARWVGSSLETRFPLATLLINVSGSFILGLIGGALAQRSVANADALRLALGVGFCGGFTTFSTFAFETHALLEDGNWLPATLNLAGSVVASLVAVRVGIMAGRALVLRFP